MRLMFLQKIMFTGSLLSIVFMFCLHARTLWITPDNSNFDDRNLFEITDHTAGAAGAAEHAPPVTRSDQVSATTKNKSGETSDSSSLGSSSLATSSRVVPLMEKNDTSSSTEKGVVPDLSGSAPLACCKPSHQRCDWVAKAPYTIPECEKNNLVALLQWIDGVLGVAKVDWMIAAGTLLGAVRNQGHIPHETDIDILVDATHWTKAQEAIKLMGNGTAHVLNSEGDLPAGRLFFSKVNTIHVDIWLYRRQAVSTTFQFNQISEYPTGALFPLTICSYEGIKVPCPRKSVELVAAQYGPTWRVPKLKYNPNPTYHDRDFGYKRTLPHECGAMQRNRMSRVFTDSIRVLEGLNASYNLHGGTLLNFVRDCELKDDDIDFTISLEWLQRNHKAFTRAFRKAGFQYAYDLKAFGQLDQFGYEVAWKKNGVKVDMFSRIDFDDKYVTALWKSGQAYKCSAYRQTIANATWGDLTVKVPIPYDSVLQSWYGKDWKKPFTGKWRWFEDAFEIGSCEKKLING